MNIKYATEFAREFIKNHPEHKEEVLDFYALMKDEISEGGSPAHEIDLFISSCNDLLTKDNLAKDDVEKANVGYLLMAEKIKGIAPKSFNAADEKLAENIKSNNINNKFDKGNTIKGGGVGKMYYHIIEYGQYDNIGYQGYYDTIEEAEKEVKRLSEFFPNQSFQIYMDNTKNEPPITTMHNGGGVKQNSLMSMTKFYVMDAKDGKILSKGFDTEEEAKVEKYKMFEETGNKFLVTKTITKGKDEYWERRENLEMFLNLNDEAIYWKWVNGELTDLMAVQLIEEVQGVKFDTTEKYYNGGFVGKGELVWRKLMDSEKAQFLYENFTPQITPRTQEILVGKTFQFLPKIVKMKIESKYANVEQFAKGNTIKEENEDYSHKVGETITEIDRNPYGLDPNIFIGELENKDPKYFIGVKNMKDMMKSLYTYNYGEVDKNDKYLIDYQEKLGKSLFDKTYNEELKILQEYEVESNVFTDSEGLTYNSLKKKMMAGGGVDNVKYRKGGPVKDYTGIDFSKLIDDLKVFLIKYPYIWKKDGKSYVPIEGWQFAAALMGYSTRVVSVNEIENGYMSMAEVIDQDGKVVGSGFGLVTKDEAKWTNSQKYELASFSQTRAVSRALRNCISWVIKAAGYKTTPAEEMYGVGSSKMQNMPKYNAPAIQTTQKTIVQYPTMKASMTPPMTTESSMPDAFEEMADILRPQKSPMAKNPNFKYKDILRDLYSQAIAYSIVLVSPKFMSDLEESLLIDNNDLHYTMLERAYLHLLDNNIVLKTTRYMTKLRKIVSGENFAYGGLLKELPTEIYNAIVESGHQNDIISFDIEPFNSDGDRDKTINAEGVDYYISTKINSEEIANDLNNNTSLNHNYYIADIGGNELLISDL